MDDKNRKVDASKLGTRRQEIYTAATRLFAEKGYRGTSMQDIADEVGLLKGSLYHHFRSKDELLHDILMRLLAKGVSELEEINALSCSPSQQVRLAVRSIVLNFLNQPEPARIFGHGMRSVVEASFRDVREKARVYRELVGAIIQRGVKAGEFRPVDVKRCTLALLGMSGSVHFWYRADGSLSPAEISDVLADLLLQGFERRDPGSSEP